MYWAAKARMGAPVGTPGNGPLDPATSMWEYGRGFSESSPCCKRIKTFIVIYIFSHTTNLQPTTLKIIWN